jgi:hypothetical protein
VFEATELVEIPITIKLNDSKESFKKIKIKAYIVEAENVPLLCGRNTMVQWEAKLDMKEEVMKIKLENEMDIKCLNMDGGHLVVQIYEKEYLDHEEVIHLIEEEKEDHTVKKIKKIHEALYHKGGKLNSTVRKNIKEVIENCKVCQQNQRSQGCPKITLPKVSDFNKIITMDLKTFTGVNVLWLIDSFN